MSLLSRIFGRKLTPDEIKKTEYLGSRLKDAPQDRSSIKVYRTYFGEFKELVEDRRGTGDYRAMIPIYQKILESAQADLGGRPDNSDIEMR